MAEGRYLRTGLGARLFASTLLNTHRDPGRIDLREGRANLTGQHPRTVRRSPADRPLESAANRPLLLEPVIPQKTVAKGVRRTVTGSRLAGGYYSYR